MPLLAAEVDISPSPSRALSYGVKISDGDAMSLQHFVVDLLPVFLHSKPYTSLSRIAFYSCVTEWTVLRAMVAMMHSHNNRAYGFDSTLLAISRHHSSDSVHQQYSRALLALNNQINNAVGHKSSEIPIYISCLFLMCFEQFQGELSQSQQHLKNMKQIVSQRAKSRPLTTTTCQEQSLLQEIYTTFTIIDLEFAEAFDDSPVLGGSLKELDQLVEAADRFRQDLVEQGRKILATAPPDVATDGVQHCLASCLGRIVCLTGSTAHHTRWQRLLNDHKAWYRRFEMLDLPSSNRQVWMARIHYFFSSQVLQRLQPVLLIDNLAFEQECTLVLRLAEQYLSTFMETNDKDTPTRTDEDPTVSIVYNVVRALYFIALRSEQKQTRSAAIAILYAAKRREGTISSLYLAEFAAAVDLIVQSEFDHSIESCMPHEVIDTHERGSYHFCHILFGRLLFNESQQPKSVQLKEYRRTGNINTGKVDLPVSTSWFLSSEQTVSLAPYL